jgi:hypothetical protein
VLLNQPRDSLQIGSGGMNRAGAIIGGDSIKLPLYRPFDVWHGVFS